MTGTTAWRPLRACATSADLACQWAHAVITHAAATMQHRFCLHRQPLCCPALCSFQRLVFTTAAKLFSNTCRVMVDGGDEAVGYLNPLLAMAAVINVSLPGQQPDLRVATEDMRLLNSSLVDKSGRVHAVCVGCPLGYPSPHPACDLQHVASV